MRVIDSHTEGEPTRVIVDGGPPLGHGPLAERLARFAGEFDHFRRFAVNEPRGHDALVGALHLRAARPLMRRRRYLLQQCRISRHVRPWRDRPCRDPRLYGPAQAWAPSLRDAGRNGRRGARRRLHGDGRECRELSSCRGGLGRSRWSRNRARRRRLGRQLVLPHLVCAVRSRARECGSVDGGRDRDTRRADCPGRPRQGRRLDRPYRVLRPGRDRTTRTAAILSSVPAGPTTGHRAEPEPAPSLRASAPTESCARARFGCRRASSAAAFARASNLGPNGGVLPRITGRAFICAESKLVQDPADPFRYGFGG